MISARNRSCHVTGTNPTLGKSSGCPSLLQTICRERAMPHAVNTKLMCHGGFKFLRSRRKQKKLSCPLYCEQNVRKNVVFLFGRAFSLEILYSKTECGFWTWASKSTVSTVSQCFKRLKRHVTVTNDMSRCLSVDGRLPQTWLSGQ